MNAILKEKKAGGARRRQTLSVPALKSGIENKYRLIQAHKRAFCDNRLDLKAALPEQYPLFEKFEMLVADAELRMKSPFFPSAMAWDEEKKAAVLFQIYTKLSRTEKELCSILVMEKVYPKEYLFESG
ncbi:MAG: hypothetical protein NTX79_07885 [Candidatus Micrarchaeota archaeon]|nr:hypothetical protein [Candidatus Micrarchaeota archaeon]